MDTSRSPSSTGIHNGIGHQPNHSGTDRVQDFNAGGVRTFNGELKMLRLETAQAFCDAFGLRVSEFFEMVPGPPRKLEVRQSASGESIDITGAEVDFSSFFFAAGELYTSKQ